MSRAARRGRAVGLFVRPEEAGPRRRSGRGVAPATGAALPPAAGGPAPGWAPGIAPGRQHLVPVLLGDVVVVSLEARAGIPRPAAKACSSSRLSSLTRWHHRRPRHHQSASSTSTAMVVGSHGWRSCCERSGGAAVGPAVDEVRLGRRLHPPLARYKEPHRRYHTVSHLAVRPVDRRGAADRGPGWRPGRGPPGAVLPRRHLRPGCRPQRGGQRGLGQETLAVARAASRRGSMPSRHWSWPPPTHRLPGGGAGALSAEAARRAGRRPGHAVGASRARYAAYVAGVRARVRARRRRRGGRAGGRPCCGGSCDRPALYRTAPMQAHEPRARANLAAELAALEAARPRSHRRQSPQSDEDGARPRWRERRCVGSSRTCPPPRVGDGFREGDRHARRRRRPAADGRARRHDRQLRSSAPASTSSR